MPSKLSKAATTDVLSDIPLLCIGVMGIGIFTFLFLVKKVCRTSVFLHGSSFLAFLAATLDLSRIVTVSKTDKGDTNVLAFIISREVLLSLAYPLLNLYLWELVAKCPRSEVIPMAVTKERKWHSASWERWGFPGEALKWISLATLLTVPALQLVWRLLPAHPQHSTIYVADSALEIILSFVFILKFLFNAYGSLSKPFWQAIRPNIAPILTLLINLSLSIGQLPLFNFSDSPLGRFLYAIGVYILLLFNLYTSFQDFVDSTLIHNKWRNEPVAYIPQIFGKGKAQATISDARYRRPPFRSKSLSLSSLTEKPNPPSDIRGAKPAGLPSDMVDRMPSFWADDSRDRSSSLIAVPASTFKSPASSILFSTTRASTPRIRPDSLILTSSVQDTSQVATPALEGLPTQVDTTALDQDVSQKSESPRRQSTTSLDKILRHRDEVEQSIAALRELSPPCSAIYAGFDALDTLSTSIPTSTTEDTRSHNSVLSLSKFPDPPSDPRVVVDVMDSNMEVVTIRSLQSSSQRRRKRFNEFRPLRISGNSIILPEMLRPGSRLESTGTQWDVTSFIGNLTMTEPPMYTQSGVGPSFPRTYSQLITSPVLESLVLHPEDD